MLADLIQRLEQAEGPCGKLDAEIAIASKIGCMVAAEWFWTNFQKWEAAEDGRVWAIEAGGLRGPYFLAPRYTSCTAASDTIPMPEGMRIAQINFGSNGQVHVFSIFEGSLITGIHKNEAMARTIARLKAREAVE